MYVINKKRCKIITAFFIVLIFNLSETSLFL